MWAFSLLFDDHRGSIIATRLSREELDFGRARSVTAGEARVVNARDFAPPGIGPLRGFGGDGDIRRCNRKGSRHGQKKIRAEADRIANQHPSAKAASHCNIN